MSDNTKLPAYPLIGYETSENGAPGMFSHGGFTKLELASLMMAQGRMADGFNPIDSITFASECVTIAKAVLEEANK